MEKEEKIKQLFICEINELMKCQIKKIEPVKEC